jgi:hypothetical protein
MAAATNFSAPSTDPLPREWQRSYAPFAAAESGAARHAGRSCSMMHDAALVIAARLLYIEKLFNKPGILTGGAGNEGSKQRKADL